MKIRSFLPLLTYPDAHSEASIRNAAALAGLVSAELHVVALEADVPPVTMSNGPLIAGFSQAFFCPYRGHGPFRGHGLMMMFGSDASTCAARSMGRSRLNEVTTTTVPAGHHRSGFRPAISG